MRHTGTLELETDRLLLRRLLSQDAPQMYENWANDPAVTRFLRWEPHKSPAEPRELLSAWAELYPNPDYYQWAIVEKATGQVFGSLSVYNALLGEPQQKPKWQGLELSAQPPVEAVGCGRAAFRRHLGAGLLHRAEVVGQRLYHRSAASCGGFLVQTGGRCLSHLLPRGAKPRQRPGDGKGWFCVPPQRCLPQI